MDRERTVLVGNVVLNSSGGRVSRAARVEYDDAANLARLSDMKDELHSTSAFLDTQDHV